MGDAARGCTLWARRPSKVPARAQVPFVQQTVRYQMRGKRLYVLRPLLGPQFWLSRGDQEFLLEASRPYLLDASGLGVAVRCESWVSEDLGVS